MNEKPGHKYFSEMRNKKRKEKYENHMIFIKAKMNREKVKNENKRPTNRNDP